MNLGQAAAVCLYELATRAFIPAEPSLEFPRSQAAAGQDPAIADAQPGVSSADLEILAGLVDDVMVAAITRRAPCRKPIVTAFASCCAGSG